MANTSTNTVVAYFSSHAQAQSAVDALKGAGFTSSQIGLAARGGAFESGRSTISATDTSDAGSSAYQTGKHLGEHTESAWEKIKDFFEGGKDETSSERNLKNYPDQASYDPNPYGQFGPDDMRESLSGLSVPEQNSRYFGHRFQNDEQGAVVTVSTSDRQEEAAAILEEYDGDLGQNAASYDYSSSIGANVAAQSADQSNQPVRDTQNIRLYGEVLRVHKDRIDRGEVRVRKEVITETQTVEVPVTREELVIERNAVSGAQSAGRDVSGEATFEEQEIRIPLTEETASVDKQAVVREEVRVGKREVTNVQSVDEKVRHEELKVDDSTKTA